MKVTKSWVLLGLALVACNPYQRYTGNVSAGPVDPVNFPPECLGTGGNRLYAGMGNFIAAAAFAPNAVGTTEQVGYFAFNFSDSQLDNTPLDVTTLPVPNAYVFDPVSPGTTGTGSPFGGTGCTATPDPSTGGALGDISYAEQGTIFTALPKANYAAGEPASTSYVPVVAEVDVTSNGEQCQSLKSEKELLASSQVNIPGGAANPSPSGKYLAFAIIDPGAGVYGLNPGADAGLQWPPPIPTGGQTEGFGMQKWGWYGQYLLAYISGGYIPMNGSTMVTQTLVYPTFTVLAADGGITASPAAMLGGGMDVFQAWTGQAGYSPVCQVLTYDAGTIVDPSVLPTDLTTINSTYGGILTPGNPPYVFCLPAQ
jgi:hypothetical protein